MQNTRSLTAYRNFSLLLGVLFIATTIMGFNYALEQGDRLVYLKAPLGIAVALTEFWQASLINTIIKALKSRGEALINQVHAETALHDKINSVTAVQTILFVALGIVYVVSDIARAEYSKLPFDIAYLAFMIWLNNRNGKRGQDEIKKLLGEKSKAMRDRLVESMPEPKGLGQNT